MTLLKISSYNLFFRAINANEYRHPQTATRLENLADAFMNRIDGFKPFALKARDPNTHYDLFALTDAEGLKGKIGRKFINWVKTKRQGDLLERDVLHHSGASSSKIFNVYTQTPVFKKVNNQKFWTRAILKDGKVQVLEKLDKNTDWDKAYSVYERNAQGKLKKVFQGDSGQFQLKAMDAGKNPNPLDNNAQDIFYAAK